MKIFLHLFYEKLKKTLSGKHGNIGFGLDQPQTKMEDKKKEEVKAD